MLHGILKEQNWGGWRGGLRVGSEPHGQSRVRVLMYSMGILTFFVFLGGGMVRVCAPVSKESVGPNVLHGYPTFVWGCGRGGGVCLCPSIV